MIFFIRLLEYNKFKGSNVELGTNQTVINATDKQSEIDSGFKTNYFKEFYQTFEKQLKTDLLYEHSATRMIDGSIERLKKIPMALMEGGLKLEDCVNCLLWVIKFTTQLYRNYKTV